ncbi:MAG: hypothetical protein M1816_003888 [Peltula sp. TS41687]|nr:MAG: hypothetical protein M1816_003888 [Peltula sp. TS41687]
MGKSKKRKRNASTDETPSENVEPALTAHSDDDVDESPDGFQARPRAGIDPTTGLRTAFPGLEDDHGDELFYGPASDGLEYLRMVRLEAKGVPNLLVAPKDTEEAVKEELYNSGYGDMRGYYQDGAYTALPDADSASTGVAVAGGEEEEEEEEEEPQDVYHKSLLLRYRLLRANLRIPPPPVVLALLDENHPISLPVRWKQKRALRDTDPQPGQVAAFDQRIVLRLLQLLTGGSLRMKQNIRPRAARWIWVLLGRLEDVGCLSSEEVSVVRELGKKAVAILVGIGGRSDDDEQSQNQNQNHNAEDADGDTAMGNGEEDLGIKTGRTEKGAAMIAAATDTDRSSLEKEKNGIVRPSTEDPSTGKLEDPPDEDLEEGEVDEDMIIASDPRSSAKNDERVLHNHPAAEGPTCSEEKAATAVAAAANEPSLAWVPTALPAATAPTEEETDDEPFPSANTTATLDMIITIVGESYGQRDLLEFREIWE